MYVSRGATKRTRIFADSTDLRGLIHWIRVHPLNPRESASHSYLAVVEEYPLATAHGVRLLDCLVCQYAPYLPMCAKSANSFWQTWTLGIFACFTRIGHVGQLLLANSGAFWGTHTGDARISPTPVSCSCRRPAGLDGVSFQRTERSAAVAMEAPKRAAVYPCVHYQIKWPISSFFLEKWHRLLDYAFA